MGLWGVVGIGDGVINFVNKMERGIADGVGGALTQKAAASWPPTPKGSMATQLHCHCTDWGLVGTPYPQGVSMATPSLHFVVSLY